MSQKWRSLPLNSNGHYIDHKVQMNEFTISCTVCLKKQCDTKLIPCGHLIHWDCYNPCDPCLSIQCPICHRDVFNWCAIKNFANKKWMWIVND